MKYKLVPKNQFKQTIQECSKNPTNDKLSNISTETDKPLRERVKGLSIAEHNALVEKEWEKIELEFGNKQNNE